MMKPVKVKDVDLAFGGNMQELLPKYDEIPKEFIDGTTKWDKYISDLFYGYINELSVEPKEGVDVNDALRHIKAILVSLNPKHEHKMAGCAYLLSEFFDEFEYTKVKK